MSDGGGGMVLVSSQKPKIVLYVHNTHDYFSIPVLIYEETLHKKNLQKNAGAKGIK